MNYAIIAAGDGSRLVKEGVGSPKPLVCLNGERMIDRLIRIFCANNAQSISIIVNEKMAEVSEYLKNKSFPVKVNLIVKSTPSSMHSFYELSKILPNSKFCLTTVDTIFKESEFSRYISEFEKDNISDGLFAVTDYIEDESPLYVDTNQDMKITDFKDKIFDSAKFISGGIYCLNSKSFEVLEDAINSNQSRMRNFQRALIHNNFNIKAYLFSKIIDVDHASDIAVAEEFIKTDVC
ncbi:MAG: NDP-sugar synthase [Bacteroidales bacterium]|nr:NDP-sugar synthase [Bacteroidales bacterium]